MERIRRRWLVAGFAALCLALFVTITPVAAASLQGQPQTQKFTAFKGRVISAANVRSGPTLHDRILSVYAPGTTVTVYAQVRGDSVWAGNIWNRITPTTSSPRYIYSALIQRITGVGGTPAAPTSTGKSILVSISRQWLWAYLNGKAVFNTPVTTAMPGLVTPLGTYRIFNHLHPTTFYSPWPPGSPYYYPPTHIEYAMGWRTGGFFLHDSSWRSVFGPGTNVWHYDPKGGWMAGTHGCVTAPFSAIKWLYSWAPNGTIFKVVN